MNAAEINILEEVELENPIFIEALPGLGHVGKLAADHMIDELGANLLKFILQLFHLKFLLKRMES